MNIGTSEGKFFLRKTLNPLKHYIPVYNSEFAIKKEYGRFFSLGEGILEG